MEGVELIAGSVEAIDGSIIRGSVKPAGDSL